MHAEQAWAQRRRFLVRTGHELQVLLTNPERLGAWLGRARRARIWLAVVVLLGLFVVPVVSETVADHVFEPRRTRRLFSRSVTRDPRSKTLQFWLELGFWLGGIGLTARSAWRERPTVDAQLGSVGEGGAAPPRRSGAELPTLPAAAVLPASAVSRAPTAVQPAAPRAMQDSEVAPQRRYRIDSELGRGGMGVVYRATDTVLDRPVALKALPVELFANPELVARFQREAKVLAALAHPNIVAVFDLVQQDGELFMAMELVQGRDLGALLEEEGSLPQGRALTIGLQTAQALAHAHAHGVVHRDFKPDNVLLTADGTPKVTDFGIAKAQNKPQMTQVGAVMGTPHYMSPEQASGGEVDARTDLYALGVTLYQLLSGEPPFLGNVAQVLMKHLSQEPAPLAQRAPQVDPRVCELVHALLEKDRERRPANMTQVVEQLQGLQRELSV